MAGVLPHLAIRLLEVVENGGMWLSAPPLAQASGAGSNALCDHVAHKMKEVLIDDNVVTLQIWDTAG